MSADWADDRAFAWCAERGLSVEKHGARLAALLREVTIQAEQNKLNAMRRVVEEVRGKWATFHSVCPAVATEILDRLEAL